MIELKLLAAFIQLCLKKVRIKAFLFNVSKVADSFEILDYTFFNKISEKKLNKFSDFRLYFNNYFKKFKNTEAHICKELINEIKQNWIELKSLSDDAVIQCFNEYVQSIVITQISEITVSDEESGNIIVKLEDQLKHLKDINNKKSATINCVDISSTKEMENFILYQKSLKAAQQAFQIPTGFNTLDHFLGGGLGQINKRLSLLLALPKRFKTTLCLNLALNAFRQGYNVSFISFENSIDDTLRKIELIYPLEKLNKIKKKYNNYIDIQYFPAFTFTNNDLRLYLDQKLENNKMPHVVFLDYLDIMGNNEKYNTQDFLIQNRIIYGLRDIVNTYGIFLWAIALGNRSSAIAPKMGIEHVGRDFSRIAGVDYVIAINMTKAHRENGFISLGLLESRWVVWGEEIKKDSVVLMRKKSTLKFIEYTKNLPEKEETKKPQSCSQKKLNNLLESLKNKKGKR